MCLGLVVLHQSWIEARHEHVIPTKPVAWSTVRPKLRNIRNDAVSSIKDNATCATTSAFRPQRRLRPGGSTSADLSPVTGPCVRSERRRQAAQERAQGGQHDARHITRVSMWNGTVIGS